MKKSVVILSAVMCLLLLFSMSAFAQDGVIYLDVTDAHHEIVTSGTYYVTGTSVSGGIEVKNGAEAHVTLDNVTIDFRDDTSPAIYVEPGSSLYLTLKGTSYLYGGDEGANKYGHAGISVGCDPDAGTLAKLYIDGDGTLYAYGYNDATSGNYGGPAGIGGNANCISGYIEINGGTVYAYGGTPNSEVGGAGIGTGGAGGQFFTSANEIRGIIINGGTVYAYGGNEAAGIGGGSNNDGGVIEINGGSVYAYGGSENSVTASWSGAGIGGGDNSAGAHITIMGGNVYAVGGRCSAGIGGGNQGRYSSGDIDIAIGGDAVVHAIGGSGRQGKPETSAAGIGTGYNGSNSNVLRNIIIGDNAVVTAEGGSENSDDIGSSAKAQTEYDIMSIVLSTENVNLNEVTVPDIAQVYASKINILAGEINENLDIYNGEIYIIPKGFSAHLSQNNVVSLFEGGQLIIEGEFVAISAEAENPDETQGPSGIISYGGTVSGEGAEIAGIVPIAGEIYTVKLPAGEGYKVIASGEAEYTETLSAYSGKAFEFNVVLESEYIGSKVVVKINGEVIPADDNGAYSVFVTADNSVITVEGVESYVINMPSGKGYKTLVYGKTEYVSSAKAYSGSSFRFTVALESEYNKSDVVVKVNGETCTPDSNGVYTVTPGNSTVITVEGVQNNTARDIKNFFASIIEFLRNFFESLQRFLDR